jgi:oligosaccharide repeat unit polymerase
MKPRGGLQLSNPALAFVAAWGFTLWLHSLRLTTQLVGINAATLILVGANMATAVATYVPLALYFPARGPTTTSVERGDIDVLRRWTRVLGVVWFVGSLFEIAVSGGLPILWIFVGDPRSYAEFGIPMFHGLMQALFMFVLTGVFLEGMLTGNRRCYVNVALLALWPVIQLSRGSMMWTVLELTAVWLVLRPVRFRQLMMAVVAALTVSFVFGLIGDIRSEYTSAVIMLAATERGKEVFGVAPSGFVWVYMYVTTPINNIVAGIERVVPTFVPVNTLSFLLPSTLRGALFPRDPGMHSPLGLVDEAFNTSTIYVGFLADWGYLGAIFGIAVMQAVAAYFHVVGRRGSLWAILAYASMFQAVVLSIFADSFTTLVTFAQIALTVGLGIAIANNRRRRASVAVSPA